MPRTLLLDLDGTLVDSVPDLAAALNRRAGGARAPAVLALPRCARWSATASRCCSTAPSPPARGRAGCRGAGRFPRRLRRPCRRWRRAPIRASRRRSHALAAAGWRLAVCTNKPEAAARALLAALGLARLFAAIGGGDSFPARKPDPAHLLATLPRPAARRRTR